MEPAPPAISFERLFKSSQGPRDKFLSRLFGIFSEDIVRIWSHSIDAPYEDLGRPTLKLPGETRGRTLDFTFRSRSDGRLLVGEMKCELEYESYRYLTLRHPTQLDHHKGDAFQRFLKLAADPKGYTVTVDGKELSPSGVILVWGRVTGQGRREVKTAFGLTDILSVEEMIHDLTYWKSQAYGEYIDARSRWCDELFSRLGARSIPSAGPGTRG